MAPVTIRVSFHPQSGATIDVMTFRVLYYGFFDITSRIVQHAVLSASGISAANAQLPSGHHQVTVQIADNMRRFGSRTFEFTVV
jgi:hypothetical protein